jgi:hypothetical protein
MRIDETTTLVALIVIPVDFSYPVFALVTFLNGIESGMFASPNALVVISAAPAEHRGAAAGVRGTFLNAGSSLSIGVFFSLMVVGLAARLPGTMSAGLQQHAVPGPIADRVAGLPPVGTLFAAFLGDNPVRTLLRPTGALDRIPAADAGTLTGTTFFPRLISGPFHQGLVIAFGAAALMTVVAALASAFAVPKAAR